MTPNEYGAIRHLAVTHARDAFVDQPTIDRQWEGLAFTGRPEFSRAVAQHDAFVALLRAAGAVVHLLPPSAGTTLDAIYARDASLACPDGIVLCSMGKAARTGEPEAQRRAYTAMQPSLPILGRIEPPGTIEGGDVVWLGPRTLAVGVGYRTNAEG
ncbi:MAG TPA: arginine deiminase family protein, partial [Vicinamibacterales bacterium]